MFPRGMRSRQIPIVKLKLAHRAGVFVLSKSERLFEHLFHFLGWLLFKHAHNLLDSLEKTSWGIPEKSIRDSPIPTRGCEC